MTAPLFSIVTPVYEPPVDVLGDTIASAQFLRAFRAYDPATFVGNALSPARALSVTVVDAAARAARVVVPDFQLSLAIGKEGQNARLAARLTGWRIDIRSDAAAVTPQTGDGG